jgi:hypothetical protein
MAFSKHPLALRDYVDRLKGLQRKLSNPEVFFAEKREEYMDVARTVVFTVLNLGRPAEIDAGEWVRRVNLVAGRLSSELVIGAEDEARLSIFLTARMDDQQQFEEIAGASPGIFAKDTVLQWVRAGRTEDPLGKQFDERDFGHSDETIAARVWWALYTGRSLHSQEQIRTYLQGRTYGAVAALLPAVMEAWQQTLGAMVRKDWRAWVKTAIKTA